MFVKGVFMKIDTLSYDEGKWHVNLGKITDKKKASIVFLFGDSDSLKSKASFTSLRQLYATASIVGASSSGNIQGSEISQSSIIATAVQFEKGSVAVSRIKFTPSDDVEELSRKLMAQLPQDKLKHVFVLSDGLNINGSELVRGINKAATGITVTGGMAGDGDRFENTWTIADAPAQQFQVVAIGFYGDDFCISTGCRAGWSPFGADRIVTKSSANVLYELDNQPALDLYKEYLGEFAKELPESGLRFPLNIKEHDGAEGIIRTLLAVDEDAKSITFAGDIPEGYTARLMKPNINELIRGAEEAAENIDAINSDPALGLIVSCIGRRVVLRQIVEDELEAVEDVLGQNVQLAGFYSYGEFAPFESDLNYCELHNQTMTLTAVYEK